MICCERGRLAKKSRKTPCILSGLVYVYRIYTGLYAGLSSNSLGIQDYGV